MAEVWSLMIWLKQPGWPESDEVADKVRAAREAGEQSSGHRARVFNPPALQRVSYGQFESRDRADAALLELAQRLNRGETITVRLQSHAFLIPASSVHYVALGQGNAGAGGEL